VSSLVTRFKLDQIGEASQHLALLPTRDWIESLDLGVEGKIASPLRIDLEMNRSGEEVFVDGRIEGRVGLPCYRCLEPASAPLSGSFRATYLPPSADRAGAHGREIAEEAGDDLAGEPDPGDEDVYYQVDGVIDLLPMLREQILVVLPERALCRESCQGLCASCGADLNAGSCDCSSKDGFSKLGKLRDLRIR